MSPAALPTENMLHTQDTARQHMLNTCCPFTDTQPHAAEAMCRANAYPLVHSTHTRHIADMLDWTCHCLRDTHTRYMLYVPRTGHTPHLWGTSHSQCIHHTCWWGPQVPHTQCTEHTHAHTHTPTAKGLTTSSAAQLRAPHPARPVLSWGHTDSRDACWEPDTKSPWLSPALLSPPQGPFSGPGSSPALLSQLPPPEAHSSHPPSHSSPFLEAYTQLRFLRGLKGQSWKPQVPPAGPPDQQQPHLLPVALRDPRSASYDCLPETERAKKLLLDPHLCCLCSCFADEETETRNGWLTCPSPTGARAKTRTSSAIN